VGQVRKGMIGTWNENKRRKGRVHRWVLVLVGHGMKNELERKDETE
jgi:hypothetical protein